MRSKLKGNISYDFWLWIFPGWKLLESYETAVVAVNLRQASQKDL